MSPRGRNRKPKTYRCQDCGATFYDMAGTIPDRHRERLATISTVRALNPQLERHTVTTFSRTSEPILGTFWMDDPDGYRATPLCRACGQKRGYIEGGTDG